MFSRATVLALALIGVLTGSPASEAVRLSGQGTIYVYVTSTTGSLSGSIVITGALAGYGRTLNVDRQGDVDPAGGYVKALLHHGTLEIDTSSLAGKATSTTSSINRANCSFRVTVTGIATVIGGTGAYKTIQGRLTFTIIAAGVAPRMQTGKSRGTCDWSNGARPMAEYTTATGVGAVAFRR